MFYRNIWYDPKETAVARMAAILAGVSIRRAVKLRRYAVTTQLDRFERYRTVYGLLGIVKMYLVSGFRLLFHRPKDSVYPK
jgi:hypothetical protein